MGASLILYHQTVQPDNTYRTDLRICVGVLPKFMGIGLTGTGETAAEWTPLDAKRLASYANRGAPYTIPPKPDGWQGTMYFRRRALTMLDTEYATTDEDYKALRQYLIAYKQAYKGVVMAFPCWRKDEQLFDLYDQLCFGFDMARPQQVESDAAAIGDYLKELKRFGKPINILWNAGFVDQTVGRLPTKDELAIHARAIIAANVDGLIFRGSVAEVKPHVEATKAA